MTKIHKRLVILLSAAAATAALTTTTVLAAGGDTDDNISPAGAPYMATNSGNVTFTGTINSVPVTVNCTTSTISGSTPMTGLGPQSISDPMFSGCTDTLGGKDTVTTNHNNGSWTVTFIDAANDETSAEPNATGDSLQLGIPQAGATVVSSALPSCTITVSPGGPTPITGAYDDNTTVKFMNQSIGTSGSGCSPSATTMNGTYVSNVSFHDAS